VEGAYIEAPPLLSGVTNLYDFGNIGSPSTPSSITSSIPPVLVVLVVPEPEAEEAQVFLSGQSVSSL